MNKYIDADKLKELLKERQEEKDYREVIWLIDSLQQEQSVIKKSNALFDECVKNCDPAIMKEVSDNIDKMLGRQPVEGLEEEIQRYFDGWGEIGDGDNIVTKNSDYIGLKDLPKIARHFAEWGAEHLKR